MSAAIALALITVLLVFFVLVMATVAITLRKSKTLIRTLQNPDNPEVTALRLIVQHNQPTAPLDQLLKPLLVVDPHFSPDDFLAQASAAFTRVTQYDGGAGASSLPVTAAMAQRLLEQAQLWSGGSFVPVTKDVQVGRAVISAVRINAEQQAVDVRLTGTWTHYIAPAGGGTTFEGATRPAPFAELATFVRPAGATSVPGPRDDLASTALTKCPHCGADVTSGIAACPYCGTQLDQTKAPWLLDALAADSPLQAGLTAITASPVVSATLGMVLSAKASGDRAPTTIAFGKDLHVAMDRIVAHDPGFSQERFLRWATQTYLTQRLGDDPSAVSVQKADPFCVLIAGTTENVIVLFTSRAASGQHVVEAGVFSRPLDAVTPPEPTAAPTAICANCGAPLSPGETSCRSCGTRLPDTIGGWSLGKIAHQGAIQI